MKIQTAKFQDLVARSVKGAANLPIIPITQLMEINLQDGVLEMTTTDSSNTLIIRENKVEGDNFKVVINADLFGKLIAKLTSEFVELKIKEGNLEVIGDGVYDLPIAVDDNGPVTLPKFTFDNTSAPETISLKDIQNIITINKPAVGKSVDTPCLNGYYMADKVITTNVMVICFNELKAVNGQYLMSPEMLDLLSLAQEEEIKWWYRDGYFLFECKGLTLYGPEHEGKDIYPIDDVNQFNSLQLPSRCKISVALLKSVLDRLSLFIEEFDKNGAYLTFTPSGIKVTSRKSSSDELIPYVESTGFQDFKCCIDIPMLKAQVDVIPGETLELCYGNDSAIKLVSGKVAMVVGLLSED